MEIKFCDYIKSIKENFKKGDTHLFLRFAEKDIHLIQSIHKNHVFTIEISESRWEEVKWDINDDEKVYPVSVFEVIKLYKKTKLN